MKFGKKLVTLEVTTKMSKLLDNACLWWEKTEFHFFHFPIFRYCRRGRTRRDLPFYKGRLFTITCSKSPQREGELQGEMGVTSSKRWTLFWGVDQTLDVGQVRPPLEKVTEKPRWFVWNRLIHESKASWLSIGTNSAEWFLHQEYTAREKT